MIYLFNNVYIAPEFAATQRPEDDVIFITKSAVSEAYTVPHFYNTVYQIQFNPTMLKATSYDDLITQLGGEQQFVALLTAPRTNRLLLLCDNETLYALCAKAAKTLLPNLRFAEDAARLVKLWLAPHYFTQPYYCQHHSAARHQGVYTQFTEQESLWKDNWVHVLPWELSRKRRKIVQQTASLELQLITYFNDPTWSDGGIFKQKLTDIVKKTLWGELMTTLRPKLAEGFADIQSLVPEIDPLSPTVYDDIAAHPVLKLLLDTDLVSEGATHLQDNYDMVAVSALFQDYIHARTLNFGDISIIEHIATVSFDEILDMEINSPCSRAILTVDTLMKHIVNPYIIDKAFMWRNDPTKLHLYSLI